MLHEVTAGAAFPPDGRRVTSLRKKLPELLHPLLDRPHRPFRLCNIRNIRNIHCHPCHVCLVGLQAGAEVGSP